MSTTRWTDFVNGATVITLVLSAISFLQVAVTTTNTVSASSSLKAAKEKLDEIDEIIKALNPEDHDKIEKLQPRLLVETRAEVNMLRKKVEKLQADLYSAKFTQIYVWNGIKTQLNNARKRVENLLNQVLSTKHAEDVKTTPQEPGQPQPGTLLADQRPTLRSRSTIPDLQISDLPDVRINMTWTETMSIPHADFPTTIC